MLSITLIDYDGTCRRKDLQATVSDLATPTELESCDRSALYSQICNACICDLCTMVDVNSAKPSTPISQVLHPKVCDFIATIQVQ